MRRRSNPRRRGWPLITFPRQLEVSNRQGEGSPVDAQMMIMLIDTPKRGGPGMVRREVVWGMCPLGVVRT